MAVQKKDDQEARESILKAAKSEFAAKGFQGARTAGIAQLAGVNKALIHYYYKNKETLYMEVMMRSMGVHKAGYDVPIYRGTWELTSSQKMYIIVYLIVIAHFRAADLEVLQMYLWELAEGGKYLKQLIEKYSVPRSKILMKLIENGIEKGEFETKYPHLVLMGLFSMINSFSFDKKLYMNENFYDELYKNAGDSEFLDFFLEYVFKFLRPAGADLDIPGVPDEIISYIDELIGIMNERGVSEEIIEQLMKIIVG